MIVVAGDIAKAWLVTLGMMAVQGTLLALVALVLVRLAGPRRPAWRAAIWLVVMAKLALPWGPGMRWSLSDLVAALTSHADAAAPVVGPPALEPLPAAPSIWPALGWLVLALAWLAFAITIVARAVITTRRAHRIARANIVRATVQPTSSTMSPRASFDIAAAPPRDTDITFALVLLDRLAERIGVRAPRLAIVDGIGPHVVGVVRPIIAIPRALLAEPSLLEAALLHELAHVRRRDALGRAIEVLASALLFFWPVVRVVARRLELARESACDAWALEAGHVAPPAYARLLVRMTELQAGALALAAPHALDARIAAVLGPPNRARTGRLQRIVVAGWAVIALGGARSAHARGDEPTCRYTPELAAALLLAHPEADVDGDGVLSRDEACELQAELRRHADELASRLDPASEAELEDLLSEPLCCNCDRAPANTSPEATCHQEGVSR